MTTTATGTATVTLGRRDYGWGVTATLVTIADEEFAQYNGVLYRACGDCDGGWSGTKEVYAGLLGGVCYRCTGRGWSKRVESEKAAVALAKRRTADRARRARKAAEKAAEEAAAFAAWQAEWPVIVALAAEVNADGPTADMDVDATYAAMNAQEAKWGAFVVSLANQASWRPLTENQIRAFALAVEKAREEFAAAQTAAAARRFHTAKVGDRVIVHGVVTVAVTIETRYGMSRLVVIEGDGDDDGVTVKVFGSGQTLWDTESGQVVNVAGTIKDFAEYDGVPQTVLTRARIVTAD